MTTKHKILFYLWRSVTRIAFGITPHLEREYMAYTYRAWESGATTYGMEEWLHRRWFPKKYDYEIACPSCGGHTTAYGLCLDCMTRWDVTQKPLRPL